MKQLMLIVFALVACSAEPELEREVVEVQGQQMTRFNDHAALRAVVERQDCRGEAPDACLLAKKGRVVMSDPRTPGLLLGPEVDPREMAQALREGRIRPTRPLRPGETVIERGLDVAEVKQPLILGSDGRNWPPRPSLLFPNNTPPAGSLATFAVSFVNGKAGTGHLVAGNGLVGVTSGHNSWVGGQVRTSNFAKLLPHQDVAYNSYPTLTCSPVVLLHTGWTIYGDRAYDVAVLNWTAAGCSTPTGWSYSTYWYPIDWITHGAPGPGSCGTLTMSLWGWGMPGPDQGNCGPRAPGTWPTSCGQQSSHTHYCPGDPQMFSGDQDSMLGHSGQGNFLSNHPTYGTTLIGVHYGTHVCAWPCPVTNTQGAVVRGPHLDQLLSLGGVW